MSTTIARPEPLMLRPTSRQFPFDEVCAEITQALEARNWKVPGIEVKFTVYGSGRELYRMVEDIVGDNFVLHFGRPQGRLGYWSDRSAISHIALNGQLLHVFEDDSGPSFAEYAGSDWKAFMLHSAYSSYKNDDVVVFEAKGRRYDQSPARATELVSTKGLHPKRYPVDELYDTLSTVLRETVLRVIEATPLATPDYSQFAAPADIPFPEGLPELFCVAKLNDGIKIRRAQGAIPDPALDLGPIPDNEYYAFQEGNRLVYLGVHDHQNPLPDIAYEGFVWCGFGSVDGSVDIKSLEIPGYMQWNDVIICRIKPNRANDVYIADHGVYENLREEIFANDPTKNRLSDDEVNQMMIARGHTIIPITDYTGGFIKPVVLIGREVEFDEVEIVHGPTGDRDKTEWERIVG